MSVRITLQTALDRLSDTRRSAAEAPDIAAARAWLARTETLLDWIAKHPTLVEFKSEAAHLIIRYRDDPAEATAATPETDAPPQ